MAIVQYIVIVILIIVSESIALKEQERPEPASRVSLPGDTLDSGSLQYTWGILPAISYDADAGFGFGGFGGVIANSCGADPFLWQFTAQLKATAKRREGKIDFPIYDHFLSFDSGSLLRKKTRLSLALFYFNQIDIQYYGLGNSSRYVPDTNSNRYKYRQHSPGISVRLKYTEKNRYFDFFSTKIRYDQIGIYQKSKISEELANQELSEHEKLHCTIGSAYDNKSCK